MFILIYFCQLKLLLLILDKKVVVSVSCWNKNKNPLGEIKILGSKNDHESEISSIIYDYGFSTSFSKQSLRFLKGLLKISSSEIKKRIDVRDIATFTIDPKEAKDFDDALSVKK